MKQLETIQTQGMLNRVFRLGEQGPGGAYHHYQIDTEGMNQELLLVSFQEGPRSDSKSTKGILDTDLLEICKDRLTSFQEGPYDNQYNAQALWYIEQALFALNKRVEDRIERDVLGTMEK